MRVRDFFIGVGFLVSASAQSASSYPQAVQARIDHALRADSAARLKAAVEQSRREEPGVKQIVELAKKNGLSAAGTEAVKSYVQSLGRGGPKAEWKEQSAVIRAGKQEIRIGHDEFLRQEALINGKRFKWDGAQPAAENLKRYDSLFASPESANRGTFPSVFREAVANEAFQIKVAGLHLYFVVGSLGEMGAQLERLNAQVKTMTSQCESPEPAAGGGDPFTAAVLRGTLDADSVEKQTRLEDCDSLRAYSRIPVGQVRGPSGETQAVLPRLPADLCTNIDRLAACVTETMGPESVSSAGEKKLSPKRTGEWSSPTSGNSDQKAKSAK